MSDFYATRGLSWHLHRERANALLDIELRSAFASMPNKLPGWEKDIDELEQLIATQNCPNEYFDFLAHGAFKETYMLHRSDNYVVKFCSQQNDTETEKALLEAAKAEGVGFAFIPTKFVNFHGLTCGMPFMLEDYDGDSAQYWDSEKETYIENEDWEGRYATALEIQPTLLYTSGSDEKHEYWRPEYAYGEEAHIVKGERVEADHVLHDPAIDPNTGEVIPYEIIYDTDIKDKHWIEQFVRFYGIDGLERLANFIQKYHVTDLHSNNIGYISGAALSPAYDPDIAFPVIIDWLSWGKQSIEEIRAEEESYKKAAAELH